MKTLHFSTKAGALAALQGVLKAARIAPLPVFTVAQSQADRSVCLSGITGSLGAGPWILRSSREGVLKGPPPDKGEYAKREGVLK